MLLLLFGLLAFVNWCWVADLVVLLFDLLFCVDLLLWVFVGLLICFWVLLCVLTYLVVWCFGLRAVLVVWF